MTKNTLLDLPVFTRFSARVVSVMLCVCAILTLAACSELGIEMQDAPKMTRKSSTSHMTPSKEEAQRVAQNKNLFGKNLRSDRDRLGRLERAVQSMRHDFDKVSPSIRRLMAIEADIQNLIGELKKLTDSPTLTDLSTPYTAPPPKVAPQKMAPTPQHVAKPYKAKAMTPAYNGQASVYKVRIGEHTGKTRIVLDVNAQTSFNVDIDNNERIMTIDLPNTAWGTAISKYFRNSPYISSYSVENTGNGSLLIFQLKKQSRISYKDNLKSLTGSGRRLVIDVAGN